MNQPSILRVSAIAALGLLITAGHAVAQTAKDLVGAWTLVTADAFGANPKGCHLQRRWSYGCHADEGRSSQICLEQPWSKYCCGKQGYR